MLTQLINTILDKVISYLVSKLDKDNLNYINQLKDIDLMQQDRKQNK